MKVGSWKKIRYKDMVAVQKCLYMFSEVDGGLADDVYIVSEAFELNLDKNNHMEGVSRLNDYLGKNCFGCNYGTVIGHGDIWESES